MSRFSQFLSGLALTVAAATANAGLWMVDTSSTLFFIDQEADPVTTIGSTGVSSLSALTMDHNDDLFTTNGSNLYTLNKTTGAATLVGSTGTSGFEGLAFDESNVLWGAAGNSLFTIDAGTGAATLASGGMQDYDDLTILRDDLVTGAGTISAGTLIGLNATIGLFAINTTTFTETFIEAIPVTVGDEAITGDNGGGILANNFDRESGGQSGIYDVDFTGGNADTLIKTVNGNITGMIMDFDAEVPVPGTALLMLGVLGGLAARKRRA